MKELSRRTDEYYPHISKSEYSKTHLSTFVNSYFSNFFEKMISFLRGTRVKFSLVLLVSFLMFWSSSVSLLAQIEGGMLDPAIDEPGKPFSYFWHPTDVIGALYAPVATEVTPEGNLYTGFGEYVFFVGNPLEPVNVRIKTLYKGYLPIIQYDLRHHGVKYLFTMFGADLGGELQGLPVNFVEVRMLNETDEARTAFVSSAYRFSAPNHQTGERAEYRFTQRFDLIPNQYTEGQTKFNRDWTYSLENGALIRDGRILYLYPNSPEPDQVSLSLGERGLSGYRYFTGEVQGAGVSKLVSDRYTPMGVVMYKTSLKPRDSAALVFKVPIVPVPVNSEEAAQVREASYAHYFQQTVSSWEDLVAKSAPLRFPERKVQEALLANTVFNLLAIDKVGDDYICNINKFQYHFFCAGSDPSHMRVGFNYMGLEEIARKTTLYSMTNQAMDGHFPRRGRDDPRILEYWGWNLWCVGRHYQLTGDASFLQQVYPGVVKAMEWEMRITHKDELGLFPPYVNCRDDAALNNVRQMSPNIWALHGMIHVINMAEAMGKTEDVRRFKGEYKRFRKAFEKQLAIQTAKSGGWIPPALEQTLLGNHWDNMMLLYPEPLFDPFDPRVTATINKSRETYAEGILGYVLPIAIAKKDDEYIFNTKPGLHYWHTPDNAHNALVRGGAEDQQWAVKDLYALLLHTTSTHAPQEFSTVPWSTRDYSEGDILPDGPASGKMIELMRNMLVREYKNDLYLFSALSPAWLQSGKVIEVNNEPTTFGPVSATLFASANGWEVKLSNQFRQAPAHVIIRVPWFYELQKVEADGKPIQTNNGKLVLSPTVRTVTISGKFKPGTPEMSFESTVEDYKREYKQRYEEFLRTGEIQP